MDVMNANLVTSFNVLRPSVKAMMKSGGGSVVLCSSAVANHGLVNHEAIAAAKVLTSTCRARVSIPRVVVRRQDTSGTR